MEVGLLAMWCYVAHVWLVNDGVAVLRYFSGRVDELYMYYLFGVAKDLRATGL